jgi:hypothetical protein
MNKLISRVKKCEKIEYFLLAVILLGGLGLRLYKINIPIADWHSWRQVDTASVTRIYLDEGIDLLRPRYYDISQIQTGYHNPQGYRFVEFPILNIIHLFLYKNFKFLTFESAGRMVSILSALVTAVALYVIGKRTINKWGGLLAAYFYLTIPFNIYFTRVILPDPLSTCFATLAVMFFLLYYEKNSRKYLFASSISFSLALLVKPFAVFYAIPIIYLVLRKFSILKILRNKSLLLSLDIVLIPFLLWRAWMNNNINFIVGIPHLSWAFNGDDIRFKPAFWRWIFGERLGGLILVTWGIVPFTYGILSTKTKYYFIHLLWIGMVLYLTVIATANVRHDYYQTFIIPAVSLSLAAGTLIMWKGASFNKWLSRIVLLFALGMMMATGLYEVRGLYNINHYEVITAGQAADKLLPKDSQVIAPDNGNTVFLYHTMRFGWPVVDTSIDELIKQGADYYVSVNKGDTDTRNFSQRFAVVDETAGYIILDLHKQK